MISINFIVITLVSLLQYVISYHLKLSNAQFLNSLTMSIATGQVNKDYPIKIRNVVSKMTSSTQLALNAKISRIELELPPGASFGVETSTQSSKESKSDVIKKSNREAARLITDMFGVFGPSTIVLFPSEEEASKARNYWGKQFSGVTQSLTAPAPKGFSDLRSRRFSAEEQRQALLGDDGVYIPDEANLIIAVGPRPTDFSKIINIHEKVGDDKLMILVNARIGSCESFTNIKPKESNSNVREVERQLRKIFVNAFNYAPPLTNNPVASGRELLLYHEYNDDWYLAEQTSRKGTSILNLGSSTTFTTLWAGRDRPTDEVLNEVLKTV